MEYIADAEAEPSDHANPVYHSFSPLLYPTNVSQGPLTEEEMEEQTKATDSVDDRCLALKPTRRYLPCHYFDYICGSSTGA